MTESPPSWVSITSGDLTALLDPHGAQLSVLRDAAGRDLLWDGDPRFWTGRAPLLFPIVGNLVDGRYRLGPAVYRLPRHGFARNEPFTLHRHDRRSAEFRLDAHAATLAVYPFRFELMVRFEIDARRLTLTVLLRNCGDADLPASVGYHPAFRWPLPYGAPREAHFIDFERTEAASIRRLDANGLLAAEPRPSPLVERRLALADRWFEEDALIWDRVQSQFVSYGSARGPRLRIGFPDTPCLGIWTKPGAGFICIEPWHGIADPAGFTGDFTQKPGVFRVSPEDTKAVTVTIELTDGEP